MKTKIALSVLLVCVAFLAAGCGLAQTLTGTQGGTVSNLWSDVPPLPNATKANISIPPLANLMIQGFVQAANSDSSSDTKLEKFDFIAFQTNQTPQQVGEFYTVENMQAAGWSSTDTTGCQMGGDAGVAGGFCAFAKKDAGGKDIILLILPVQDDSTKQTQVFFIRFEGTQKTQ